MYQEKINALEILNKHKNLGRVNWIAFRNDSGLKLDPFFDATIEELKEEGFLLSFARKQDDYHFRLSLKGIHYEEVIEDLKTEKRRIFRAEIASFVSVGISALSLLASIFFK